MRNLKTSRMCNDKCISLSAICHLMHRVPLKLVLFMQQPLNYLLKYIGCVNITKNSHL